MGNHLYFIPLGRGPVPLDHEAHCMICRTSFPVQALRYRDIGKSKTARLVDLIPRTSPWLGECSAEEAAEEARFLGMLAIFQKAEASLHDRDQKKQAPLDLAGVLGFLQMIVVPLTLIGLVMSRSMPLVPREYAATVAGVLSLMSLFWGIYVIATEQRRFFRRHTLPRLLGELEPFRAGKADWAKVIARLKRLRYPNWKRLQSELSRLNDALVPKPLEIYPDAAGSVWQPPQAPLRVR